jgi:DNA polymerase III subunit epsilon
MSDTPENKDAQGAVADDIFSRPSEFRVDTVLTVWEKAKPVKGKPNHRYDWRNGILIGPWEPGQARDGVWDMGHIEPWYKVVEKLKAVEGITREQVIDEFNNIDNLGVEDPETNRKLGVNSRRAGVERLSYEAEEETLFEETHSGEKEARRNRFRAQIDEKSQHVEERVEHYRKGTHMSTDTPEKQDEKAFNPPKRVIVWDTETTGFSPKSGDKLVEIGAVEVVDGKPTGKKYHQYINPERSIPSRATDVHGITDEDVKDMPVFKDIAQDFLDFVGDAPLVAHNASFDMRFINAELEGNGFEPIGDERKIDTLRLAKQLLPDLGEYDLDTLADHFDVDRSGRDDFHGGLVDTIILAEVYQKLSVMAKEQNVQLVESPGIAARMAPDAADKAFDRAAELEQKWQDAKTQQAPEKGGFAQRIRDEQARKPTSEIGL